MADYFVVCKECSRTYRYHPKVKGTQITIMYEGALATNAEIPEVPSCPKCGADGEWMVVMG